MQSIIDENHHSGTETNGTSQDNSSRAFERYCKATMIGAAIPIILSFAAVVASFCKGFSLDVWGLAVVLVVVTVIPCGVVGAVGAAVGRSGRASVYGSIILACVVGEYVWFDGWKTEPIVANLWLIAFVLAGFLAGGAGAVIGRTVPAIGDKAIPLRLSFRESVIAGILMVILLGCLCWIVYATRCDGV